MLTFQLVGDDDISSNIIEWYTNFWACHVDLVVPAGTVINGNTYEDETLLGARTVGGVLVRNWNYSKFQKIGRYTLNTTPAQEQLAYAFAGAQVGKAYDWTVILGFAFDRDWDHSNKWICSELALAITDACGMPILRVEYMGAATPRDISTSVLLQPTSVPAKYKAAGTTFMT